MYFRVDDTLNGSDKWAELDEVESWEIVALATSVWTRSGALCAQKRRGLLRYARVLRLVTAPRDAVDRAIAALVRVGLWTVDDADGFVFVNWEAYNGDEGARAAANAERQSRYRNRQKQAKSQDRNAEALRTVTPLRVTRNASAKHNKAIQSTTEQQGDVEQAPTIVASEARAAVVRRLFDLWRSELGHPRAQLDAKRTRAVEGRLRDGYTEQELTEAIRGCAASDWHRGKNDRNGVFDDLELICRNASSVDRFRKILLGAGAARGGRASTASEFENGITSDDVSGLWGGDAAP